MMKIESFIGDTFFSLNIHMDGGTFFFFYVDVYDFLNIVKYICLFSLLTIHDKRYQLWNRKKWLGTRVMFEFSFTSKIL